MKAFGSKRKQTHVAKGVITDGLVGWWPMNEGSGTVAGDTSGNGNDGTLTNMDPATDWVNDGERGTVLDFDGANDYVAIPNLGISANDAFTISAWFKTTDTARGDVVTFGSDSSETAHALLEINVDGDGTKTRFRLKGLATDTALNAISDIQTNDGEWHSLIGVSSGASSISLYYDGVFVDSDSGSITDSSFNTFNVARWEGAGNYYYADSLIDDVRVYNRALSAQEIAAIFAGFG